MIDASLWTETVDTRGRVVLERIDIRPQERLATEDMPHELPVIPKQEYLFREESKPKAKRKGRQKANMFAGGENGS